MITNIVFKENYELALENALKLNCVASAYIEVNNMALLPDIFDQIADRNFLILGSATNTILPEKYNGIIIKLVNQKIIHQYDKIRQLEIIKVDSGVLWDDFVLYSLENNFFGLENLSGIPGTVGASPVQNIGAYGVEVGDYIDSIDVYDIMHNNFYTLNASDCNFKYRSSIFKNSSKFIILSVNFILKTVDQPNTNYLDLQQYTDQVTSKNLRDIVIKIRNAKLPSLELLPSVGSFFQNPIIHKTEYQRLIKLDPNLVAFKNLDDNNIKISAAYLIDQTGLKPFFMHGFSVYHKHALVLVNYNHVGNGTKTQLLELAQYIQTKVFEKYQIKLHIEPNIIG